MGMRPRSLVQSPNCFKWSTACGAVVLVHGGARLRTVWGYLLGSCLPFVKGGPTALTGRGAALWRAVSLGCELSCAWGGCARISPVATFARTPPCCCTALARPRLACDICPLALPSSSCYMPSSCQAACAAVGCQNCCAGGGSYPSPSDAPPVGVLFGPVSAHWGPF